jgi:hypothetical protein
MTPLAHFLAKQLVLPVKNRARIIDTIGFMEKFRDVHCFEVTRVLPLICQVGDHYIETGRGDDRYAFLPAPRTWIEHVTQTPQGDLARQGRLFIESSDRNSAEFYSVTSRQGVVAVTSLGVMPLARAANSASLVRTFPNELRDFTPTTPDEHIKFAFFATLSLINHPKIIGRKQHMPHRGLEKRMLQTFGPGKFPLHAWTEIELDVTPTHDARRDPSIEAHYSGTRALHFCRRHLRLTNGRLVIVTSHWRGDAALGIRQSRYTVVGRDPPYRLGR